LSLGGDIADEVRALMRLDLNSLREVWRRRWGPPPSLRSADLLRRNIAWRIQAEAFGGLDEHTRKVVMKKGVAAGPLLTPGVRLAREWRGVRHEVEVLETGVRYAGETYESLSQVARKITGTRWNGPRFFGLRQTAAGRS
jgi:hypothetical protein